MWILPEDSLEVEEVPQIELSEKDLFEHSIYFSERAYAELELDKSNELDWMIVRCTEWKYEWT